MDFTRGAGAARTEPKGMGITAGRSIEGVLFVFLRLEELL